MALFVVLVLFCCVAGHMAAEDQLSVWSIVAYSMAAVVCLQASYVLTWVAHTLWGGAV